MVHAGLLPGAAALPHAGRIGPNAITRVAEALREHLGDAATASLFARAGLAQLLAQPPEHMVDEAQVTRLHAELRHTLGLETAREIARDAGRRTGDYLLAHHIPHAAQAVLKRLPAPLAARTLLSAIRGHAWTFAGSGVFSAAAGHPVVLTVRHNPLCRGATLGQPSCDFYTATFERLFRELVHAQACVVETHCEACGHDLCRFELRWR